MTEQEAKELLNKYAEGNISEEEKLHVEAAYAKLTEVSPYDMGSDDLTQIGKVIYDRLPKPLAIKKIKLWPGLTAAAAIAAIIFGVYFFKSDKIAPPVHNEVSINDILPGKQGATLTLASGKKIKLSDALNGELASEAGVKISKTADGWIIYEIASHAHNDQSVDKTNTLSTAKGETYQVRLPDGSMVYLNTASNLTYPVSFAKSKDRTVTLSGEAYFEVFKDKMHPFIVKTAKQEVRVLGTHFNLKAYPDEEQTKTTLLEGSVKVTPLSAMGRDAEGREVVLMPGQQSSFSTKGIKVNEADPNLETAWKNNKFMFESEPIQNIMKMLERWYDIEVVYEGKAPEYKFGGSVSKFDNISKVLKIMESSHKVHFKIEGRRVIVSR